MSEMYDGPVFRFVYSLPFLTRTHHTLLEEPENPGFRRIVGLIFSII